MWTSRALIRYILNLTIPGGDYSNSISAFKLVSLRLKTERQLSTRIDNVLPFFVFVPIFGRHTSFLKVFFYNLFPTISWLVEDGSTFSLERDKSVGQTLETSLLVDQALSIGWVPAFGICVAQVRCYSKGWRVSRMGRFVGLLLVIYSTLDSSI